MDSQVEMPDLHLVLVVAVVDMVRMVLELVSSEVLVDLDYV